MGNIRKYYPLTYPQRSIWYTESFYNNTSIGNIAQTVRFEFETDYSLLKKAINAAIRTNDGMRLRVVEIDGEVKQYVSEYRELEFALMDFSIRDDANSLDSWVDCRTKTPFNLIDSDLFYFAMIKYDGGNGGFYIKIHHMITDAWGMSLIINQIRDSYLALKNGTDIPDEERPSYIEYVLNEEKYKNSARFEINKRFWNEKFKEISEIAAIKTVKPGFGGIEAGRKVIMVPDELTLKLYEFCKAFNTSIFRVFLSAVYVLISRISLKEDVVVGVIIHNRLGGTEKNTAGMFAGLVPFRISADNDPDFDSLLKSLGREMTSVFKNQRYPYELLLKDLRERHGSVERLFDVVLSYQNAVFNVQEEWHFNGCETNALAIHISDREEKGQLKLEVDYRLGLFSEDEVEGICGCILNILDCAAGNPSERISRLEMLPEEEKRKLLFEFNCTEVDYTRDSTIHELFEKQVEKTPDKTAVVFGERRLTYRELNSKANQLAKALRKRGMKREGIVALMTQRSPEMLIGILGVLKAGGAYLPVDPKYPVERIRYMLKDSGTDILLTQDAVGSGQWIVDSENPMAVVDIRDECNYHDDDSNLSGVNESTDLAYVIYTSGSTGRPKGVMIGHRAVVNFIKGITDRIDFSTDKTILALTTISFDIFTLETILPLTRGMRVVIADEDQQGDIEALERLIMDNNVDMLQTTPSRMQMLVGSGFGLNCLRNLKEIMVGGEAFSEALLLSIKKLSDARIYNMYGPTETTVWSAVKDLTKAGKITIGRPIANTYLYIVDKNLNLQPLGVEGELCIGGDGLAKGYLNRPDLTIEKFVPNPFMSVIGEERNHQLMYKTGDLARWLPDGEIELLGRMDCQVKIRGFRIELGEIESRLLKHKMVKEAAAAVKEGGGGKYICMYFVSNISLSVPELREFLAAELPDYMLPSFFIQMEEIPKTPGGKTDRKALPEPAGHINTGREYEPPTDEAEKRMAEIWQEVLGIERIGVNDSFFDLGGDSVKAVQVLSRLRRYGLSLKTKDLFRYPTIRDLSRYSAKIVGESERNVTDETNLKGPDQEDIDEVLFAIKEMFK